MVATRRSQKRIRVALNCSWNTLYHASQPRPNPMRLLNQWHQSMDGARRALGRQFDIFTMGRFPDEDVDRDVVRIHLFPTPELENTRFSNRERRVFRSPRTYFVVPDIRQVHPRLMRQRGPKILEMPELINARGGMTPGIVAYAVRLACSQQ